MKQTKHIPIITTVLLILGATAQTHGQSATSTNGNPPAAASQVTPPAQGDKLFKLDGTDVTIGKLPPITFHGFASQGFLASSDYNYLAGDTTKGSFEYDEFGVNASMSPFPRTRIAAQAFMFDVGNVGNFEPSLDYCLVDYTFSDAFGIRAGRVRRPEGIYNHIQDVDLARTSVLLPQGIYDARWRDFSASLDGGSFYGNINLAKAGSLSYEFYGGMVDLSQDGGVARQIENSLLSEHGTLDSVNDNPQFGGQLWYNTPIEGLRLGASLTENIGFTFDAMAPVKEGPFTGVARIHDRYDVPWQHYSAEYVHDKWTLQAEFRTQTLIEKDTTDVIIPAIKYNESSSSHGLGTSASWYFGPAYEVNSWFHVGAYYNEYYGDLSHPYQSPSDYQKDLALSFRFDPKPWWILKVEGHYLHGTGLLFNNAENPSQGGNPWFMLALKTTFSF